MALQNSDEHWMQLALDEAQKGCGTTRPNPMVGCVIVRDQQLVAVGHHAKAGGPHAEVIALQRAKEAAVQSVVYITLEPCSHHGRTGPCTKALIDARVKKVIIGMRDPNPLVNGQGIKALRAAGIEVEVGVLKAACMQLNRAFVFAMQHSRPWIVGKIAQSLDGCVATSTGESKWITGVQARRHGHHLRASLDAILVGAGTVRADNPRLTCRIRGKLNPQRVVLDTQARLPLTAHIFQKLLGSHTSTWICVSKHASAQRRRAMEALGAMTLPCKLLRSGLLDLQDVLEQLAALEIRSVLVEGGPHVLGSLLDAKLVDYLYAFVAPMLIGSANALPAVAGGFAPTLLSAPRLVNVQTMQLGCDWLIQGDVQKVLDVN